MLLHLWLVPILLLWFTWKHWFSAPSSGTTTLVHCFWYLMFKWWELFSSKFIFSLCNTNANVAFTFLCATVLSLLHQHRSTGKKPKEKYWQKSSSRPKCISDFTFRPFSSVLYFSSQPEISSLLALFLSFASYLKICSQKSCVFFIVVSCFLYARG